MALHGRDADLALLDETLASARQGRGRALFVTGEAGIGKSSVLGETRARAGNALVLSGAAWESGGAPPYWPWMQVLRGAADAIGERVQRLPGAERIAELVPSWGLAGAGRGASAGVDLSAARFALLDAVVRALVTLASERPLVILLDDLHAADVPTLDLLVMLLRELPAAAIAVVAAWREGELALRPDAAQRLARAARNATVQPLRRLTAEEVASWVGADGAAIFESSEGNPLFVEELVRAKKGGAPHGLRAAVSDHLALLSGEARGVLSVAAIAGREIEARVLGELVRVDATASTSDDAIERALRGAASIGVVEARGELWRFRHVLLRDQLYDELAASRRTALHRALGALLEKYDPARAAHHMLVGIVAEADVGPAIEVARRAAARAMSVYAFEDAADMLTRATTAAERFGAAALDLRLELARALHAAGLGERARAQCVEIAERAAGDPRVLADAAQAYAAELVSGRRDAKMIELIERALAAQPAGDSQTRARLMARLGAALIPELPTDPNAQELARDAIAMARRVADDESMMYVLKFAVHAFGFRMSVWEANQIACEVVALSDKIRRPLDVLEHRCWLVGSNIAIGNLHAADAALDDLAALLAPLRQPHYRWRVPILRAMHELIRGNFNEAERLISSVEELAREYEIDRAYMAASFARLSLAVVSRSPKRAQATLPTTRKIARMLGTSISDGILAAIEVIAGEPETARSRFKHDTFDTDIVLLQFAAEAIVMLEMRELAPVALECMRRNALLHPMLNGPAGSAALRPVDLVVGELLLLLDRVDEAFAPLERGLALSRALESPPFIASGAALLARALDRRGKPGDRERAVSLSAEAQQLTAQCSLETRALPLQDPAPPKPDNSLVLASRGVVAWRGRKIALPASKGGEYLATLIAVPGREVHVSDLVGDDDRGDAGEVLDAKARSAYRERAEELTAELEQARARNDLGRAERLAGELESITDELLAATGLGGRPRKAGSRVERARVNVQRRIKDAICRLASEDEALGRYLEAAVRTGTFCSFVPLEP